MIGTMPELAKLNTCSNKTSLIIITYFKVNSNCFAWYRNGKLGPGGFFLYPVCVHTRVQKSGKSAPQETGTIHSGISQWRIQENP